MLAALQFSAVLGEQSTLDSVDQAANTLAVGNNAGSQQFSHDDGTAFSTVIFTTGPSTVGNNGINLDIFSKGNVAKKDTADTSVNAGLADTSGAIGSSVPVMIVATDASEKVGDPVKIQFASTFNVKTFAAYTATADISYSASYTYMGATTSLASSQYRLGGDGVTPIGPGPLDQKTGTLNAHIGDTFTLSFSETLAGQTIPPFHTFGYNNMGWLIDATLDTSISSATLITPTSPTFASSDGGVDYGYTIRGSDLTQATTVDLDWASGATADTVVGNPIISSTTETALGTHDLHASPSQLGLPRPGAKYLLVIADPGNLISPADPSKVAALTLPDIAVSVLDWHADIPATWDTNPDAGGVNIDYSISGSDLAHAVPIFLYWAKGTTLADTLGSPISEKNDGTPLMTETAQGAHTVQISAARLAVPPRGTTNLLVVADPPDPLHPLGLILEPKEDNNLLSLDASPNAILKNSINIYKSGTQIGAKFMPASGRSTSYPTDGSVVEAGALTLAQAEAICDVQQFNWIQTVTLPVGWTAEEFDLPNSNYQINPSGRPAGYAYANLDITSGTKNVFAFTDLNANGKYDDGIDKVNTAAKARPIASYSIEDPLEQNPSDPLQTLTFLAELTPSGSLIRIGNPTASPLAIPWVPADNLKYYYSFGDELNLRSGTPGAG